MTSKSNELNQWVQDFANFTGAQNIYWCDGSDAEETRLKAEMVKSGDLLTLNPETHPNCYLFRSPPSDVARTEHLTFICTKNKDDAGPNNNWMDVEEAYAKSDTLFKGCMKGRTLYVVPYCMGPINSPFSRLGVELTDSLYVVLNMRLMTRMGKEALSRIEKGENYVKGEHSTGDLSIEHRMIAHFPESLKIRSIGSGYGGNALLGKKCHALRIASWQAKTEGWLAEHMLIVGIENPQGEKHYIAAAFPSACGKTNLAMLIAPETMPGWKITTVGDDIAWLHVGEDGRLWAINPEAGFFGVAPGTGEKTNPNALAMLNKDTIFANVALTADNQPWWEGKNKTQTPVIDWQGRPFDPANGPAAQANSRFTVAAKRCPCVDENMEAAGGVPISAIIFGGRRKSLMPLVFEARNWAHGVQLGATVASETTAAAIGEVGVIRRDPMAMKPFCGYHFADYWAHWLSFEKKASKLPKIFHVNWFRQDEQGNFMWPGFGDNLRAIEWILKRSTGKVSAKETAIGALPLEADLNLKGLNIAPETVSALLEVDKEKWEVELTSIEKELKAYGSKLPQALLDEVNKTRKGF